MVCALQIENEMNYFKHEVHYNPVSKHKQNFAQI